MDAIRIYGGRCLDGQTRIQGSKNAALPILAATLLINGVCEIENCPVISDGYHMQRLLQSIGCHIRRRDNQLEIDTRQVMTNEMPADSVGVMRSSIMLLGALIARIGKVWMEYPGGCVIGARPINLHLEGLRRMGVTIREEQNGFEASCDRLHGAEHKLPFVSVGATENLILAAVLAEGVTIIEPAAREPEIQALCEFLCLAGARIRGAGSKRLVIEGVKTLYPVSYRIPADRIVAGTYLAACLSAGGHIFLEEAPAEQMRSVLEKAACMGAVIEVTGTGMEIICKEKPKNLPYLATACYPGFPTDLQSPFLSVMTIARGMGVIEEKVFENRFRIVEELRKMGAWITINGQMAMVSGVKRLQGTKVCARELRGGAALVVAGAAAEGMTVVENKHYIDRGYEDIVTDMCNLGVRIERVNEACE